MPALPSVNINLLHFGRYKGEHKEFYLFFKNVLGFTPYNTKLYQIAFIHKSKSVEMGQGWRVNNERLEYLGDAVLSAVVAEFLYKKYPHQGEGFLTEMRSKLVSRANLNKLAQKIGLSQLIQYNRESQGVFKSIDGDAFEALVGAIYLEKGYRFTRRVIIKKIMSTYLDVDAMAHTDWNFKSKLIDWGQKNHRKISFEVERVIYQGKESRRQYDVRVKIDGEPAEHAIEYSIKAAEQLAAEKTYKKLQEEGLIPPHTDQD
jgi:ribonuclease-3